MATYSILFGSADWCDDEPLDCDAAPLRSTGLLTLELPASVRRRLERTAADDGVAPDEWASRALARALDRPALAGAR